MSTYTECPLCGDSVATLVDQIDSATIVDTWSREFGISVEEFLPRNHINHYICANCTLGIFFPPSPGNSLMYEQLQVFDWYYEDNKWEFHTVANSITTNASVLDVGCGVGRFLDILRDGGFSSIAGVETNSAAASDASRRGYVVYSNPDDAPQSFDAVCSFQVLEHVDHPKEFLTFLSSRLRTGGRLYLAVPNNDGFLGSELRLPLNMPPHHVSRWGRKSLHHIERIAPLKMIDFIEEPLPAHHIDWYLTTRIKSLGTSKIASMVGWHILKPVLAKLLKINFFRSRIAGHTALAIFEKTTI